MQRPGIEAVTFRLASCRLYIFDQTSIVINHQSSSSSSSSSSAIILIIIIYYWLSIQNNHTCGYSWHVTTNAGHSPEPVVYPRRIRVRYLSGRFTINNGRLMRRRVNDQLGLFRGRISLNT